MRSFPAISPLAIVACLTLYQEESDTQLEAARKSDHREEVTFNEHVQPILSEYCYQCHGPDGETRYPKDSPLRLDLEEHAFEPRENGKPVIIKGDPKASLMVKLMHSKDKDVVMPPPESHKELAPDQIATLEKWIEQGAEYQEHWSFIPIERPEVPASGKDWASNPIDSFIFSTLEAHGLKPNPQQDPARFYRRLHLDLTGLPPAPEDLAGFSWDKLDSEIDRLLASTASAEHFARYWLDAARYGDTHGIHIDNYRSIWPFRDWVVKAYKANMPFDQFTIEQIGGDLLPEATLDQRIATGFNRCLPTTGEGGAIDEEYEAIYAQDRTDTTSAVWLGLTVGCAACHDHKFDPISMVDTYSFNAFFRNTTMHAMDRNAADHPPNVFVPADADRDRHEELQISLRSQKQALAERRKAAQPEFDRWLANASFEAPRLNDSKLAVHLPMNEGGKLISGTFKGKEQQFTTELDSIEGPEGDAPVISGKPLELGDVASFARTDQVSYGALVFLEGTPTGALIARMDGNKHFRGWDLYLENGRLTAHVIDTWDSAANKLVAKAPLKPGKWHHVMATFDGSKHTRQTMKLYVNGEVVDAGFKPGRVGRNIVAEVPLTLGSRHRGDSKLRGGKVALQDFRFYRRLLSKKEIHELSSDASIRRIFAKDDGPETQDEKDAAFNYYINRIDDQAGDILHQIGTTNDLLSDIKARGSLTLVMEEKKHSEAYAHVLERGQYTDKGEKVPANTLSALPPMDPDWPRNRLGLARWLVAKDNPLTARVTMNRLWHQFFGTGIVETVEDFGILGARPSHPQLLDWLAAEFMDSGWDHRHMVKTIVSSSAYRQSQKISPEKLEKDPANRLISRGPRYRLDAEQIRDLALASSGLLSDKLGGPPVKPYQPQGVWEAVAMKQSDTRHYAQSKGEDLYRRSLYTFHKRTAMHPAMEILNAPSREVFCVRRELTNTPLQAFVTMNDPQFVEASRELAAIAIQASEETDARLNLITTRLISRTLSDDEREFVNGTLKEATKAFTNDIGAARELVSIGDSAPSSEIEPSELAAWTLVASQIFNLDETLTK